MLRTLKLLAEITIFLYLIALVTRLPRGIIYWALVILVNISPFIGDSTSNLEHLQHLQSIYDMGFGGVLLMMCGWVAVAAVSGQLFGEDHEGGATAVIWYLPFMPMWLTSYVVAAVHCPCTIG